MLRRLIKDTILFIADIFMILPIICVSIISRFVMKPVDIGLGPEPMINNIYHKKALLKYGYKAESFVRNTYFITSDFDINFDSYFPGLLRILRDYIVFVHAIFRYKCLFLYFNGGPLAFTGFLWRIEPHLLKLAGVRIVLMPYGGDVHELSRCPNLLFKSSMAIDYPGFKLNRAKISKKIDLWTKHANHIIGGCDWVDYMYYWDTLMLGHFSIDTDSVKPGGVKPGSGKKIIVLHAPNHKNIKGSQFFINAVEELKAEGYPIEIRLLEKLPNEELKKAILEADIVADQLIIGWYAMFALESMAMGKPVLCYLRNDLYDLYAVSGLVQRDEIPLINCTPFDVKEKIKELVQNRGKIAEIGKKSREYVIKHHSLEYVGGVFDKINKSIGIVPSSDTR